MASFTPGPWTVEEYGDDDTPSLVIHGDIDNRICFMATPGSRGDPAKIVANAHLIAAAPEMLQVLMWLTLKGGLGYEAHDRIRAAIAKAEGSTPTSAESTPTQPEK